MDWTLKMPFINISSAASFLFFLRVVISSEADPDYLYHFCRDTTTFTPNSPYQSNLNLLLASLVSNSTSKNGFYNTTTGQSPDTVYGLFLCRGDLSTDVCQDCVTFATKDAFQHCPLGKGAVIWYDECLLRYSDESFFDSVSNATVAFYNAQNTTTFPTSYRDLVRATVNDLASQVPNSTKRFETGATSFQWSNRSLYMLAQCTQDLSESNC